MNDFQEQQPGAEDERLLEEAFSVLKRMEPPLEARVANRRAVAAALGELCVVSPAPQPWWRRSVAVPVPLAAAIGLLITVLVYSSFQLRGEPVTEVVAAPDVSVPDPKLQPSAVPTAVPSKSEAVAKWKHYQSEVYLCGVGQLSSESFYGFKE